MSGPREYVIWSPRGRFGAESHVLTSSKAQGELIWNYSGDNMARSSKSGPSVGI